MSTENWVEDCKRWHGKEMTGRFAHWCNEWDGLPTDETCEEFAVCSCLWMPESERADKDAAVKAMRDSLNFEVSDEQAEIQCGGIGLRKDPRS